MPHTNKPPAYPKHKATGQAVVTIDGRDFYLGKHGTKASRKQYDWLICEWLANDRRLPRKGDVTGVTIPELLAGYLRFAQRYYHKNDKPTKEVRHVRTVIHVIKQQCGRLPVSDFGPLKLKAIRQHLMDWGHGHTYINDTVGRIKRTFEWGMENARIIGPLQQHPAGIE